MNRSRAKLAGFVVACAAAVSVASGCDASEDADLANGRALFQDNCASCHAMKEAGSTSVVGPDLDASFAAARASGMDQDTIEGIVESQIENPRQVDQSDPTYMPAKILEGDDARDVAAYIGNVAGVPGIEPPLAAGGEGGQVFANSGCAACHVMAASESTGNVGPNLDEVIPGQDDAMIEQSIVDPNAELSQGFAAGIMPDNYGDSIEPQDLELLVKYLSTCAGEVEQATGGGEPTGPAFCFNEEDRP